MQPTQLLEAEDGRHAADLVECTSARETQLRLRAIGVALTRDDEEWACALCVISAFELGERGVHVALVLHLEDVAQALALRRRTPDHIVIVELSLRVKAERMADL